MPTIITNNQYRPVLQWLEVPGEIIDKEYDYMDNVSECSFFKYKGQYYSLDQFMRIDHLNDFNGWHGIAGDSYFSGLLIKFSDDNSAVIVGRYYN